MISKRNNGIPAVKRVLVSILIALLFLIFHQSNLYTIVVNNTDHGNNVVPHANMDTQIKSRIKRMPNTDASLSIPYLDKINRFWHAGGLTEIRNTHGIKLTTLHKPNSYGTILSNGIGDNEINNFEIVYSFKIDTSNAKGSNDNKVNSGISFVISSQNDFVLKDLRSSYAMKQYILNSGGIIPSDTRLMGFPNNLPGLVLLLNTNHKPSLDIFINPNLDKIHAFNNNAIKDSSVKLNQFPIKLKKNIINGDNIKIRIIYMESISFLKIDIQYEEVGNYWIELFQNEINNEHIILPKNQKTEQRFIGMGALSNETPQLVELYSIKTSEFHWENGDENMDNSLDFAQEAENFLSQEFGRRIKMETDAFTRWKIIKSQPNYQLDQHLIPKNHKNQQNSESKKGQSVFHLILKLLKLLTIIIFIYLVSVYVRVSKRHFKYLHNKRRNSRDDLPF